MGRDHDYNDYWERCWSLEEADALSGFLSGWLNRESPEMEIFRENNVKTVCDAACGFGAHTLAFASNGFEVSAFDVSPRAVELTGAGLKKYGYENVDVKRAEITATGYADESFDAVTAYAVLDHLTGEDAARALNELLRITKKGGFLLMSFDAPSDEDYLRPHEDLPDGSMIYTEGEDVRGMIFRPFSDEMINDFVGNKKVLRKWGSSKGDRFVILTDNS